MPQKGTKTENPKLTKMPQKGTKTENPKLTNDAIDLLGADPTGTGSDGAEVQVLTVFAGVASRAVALEPGARNPLAHTAIEAGCRVAGIDRLVAVQTWAGGKGVIGHEINLERKWKKKLWRQFGEKMETKVMASIWREKGDKSYDINLERKGRQKFYNISLGRKGR